MLLHRFTVKPQHLAAYLELWPDEVALRRDYGYRHARAFVETDAEPKFTWLYSHPEPERAALALQQDPRAADLRARMAPHVFGNLVVRPVEVELMTEPAADLTPLAIMRRYAIVGPWPQFLAIWREVAVVRERYGFPCLFAVADRERDMFTWAFAFSGQWADFGPAQRDYYHDPARMALRGVFDYMADYDIHPARQLASP